MFMLRAALVGISLALHDLGALVLGEESKEDDGVLFQLILDHEEKCLGDDGLRDLCLHALRDCQRPR